MTKPPDTTSETGMPAGSEWADPATRRDPWRPEAETATEAAAAGTPAREPVQAWRAWLGEAPTDESDTDSDSEGDTESLTPTASGRLVDDDDPMAPIVSEMYARRAARRHRLTRRIMIGSAVTATAVAAGVGALVLSPDSRTSAAGVASASTTPSMTTAAEATPVPPAWCHPVDTAALIVSDGPGDASTGPGVILAQQFSLYARRDVTAVRAMFAPEAVVASEEATRTAIEATPIGTVHCVSIRPAGPDRWAVQISEKRPDGSTPQWAQTVTTAKQVDGRVLITAVTAGGA